MNIDAMAIIRELGTKIANLEIELATEKAVTNSIQATLSELESKQDTESENK